MRALLPVFLPVLLFGQSMAPPRERASGDSAATVAKGAKDSTTKEGPGAQQSQSVLDGIAAKTNSEATRQATRSSTLAKPPQIGPDPIVRYTFWLVVVGALQFVALVIQAFFLYKAFRETTTATGLTAQALAEAQRSNAANEALTLESNAGAKAATELTRQSLVLTHRPRLIVRNVVVPQFLEIPDVFPTRISATFRIVNVGDGQARILSVVGEVAFGGSWPSLPITPVIPEGAPVLFSLSPGVYGTRSLQSSEDIDRAEYDRVFAGTPATYIQGYVGYTDDVGNFRSTSFCRWWVASRRRFEAPEDIEDIENAN